MILAFREDELRLDYEDFLDQEALFTKRKAHKISSAENADATDGKSHSVGSSSSSGVELSGLEEKKPTACAWER
jgi:hypothetical protein